MPAQARGRSLDPTERGASLPAWCQFCAQRAFESGHQAAARGHTAAAAQAEAGTCAQAQSLSQGQLAADKAQDFHVTGDVLPHCGSGRQAPEIALVVQALCRPSADQREVHRLGSAAQPDLRVGQRDLVETQPAALFGWHLFADPA